MGKILRFFKNNNSQELTAISNEFIKLKDSARLLFTQSENLKSLVTNVKNSVSRSSSASHEISSTVATTADAATELETSAKSSAEAMKKSEEARQSSSSMIAEVIQSVDDLQQSVKSGLSEISSIVTTMSQIQEKAKIINEIVFQTKLLSFNASVEAARAGEYGKGFSVVAEEMAKLAALSGNASKEIEGIIVSGINQTSTQINNVTNQLNQAVDKTSQTIKQVNTQWSELSTTFSDLSDGTRLTNEKAQQITVATKEQEIGVREINSALEQLESTSVEVEKMAEDNHITSIQLSELVESITVSIDRFAKTNGVTIKRDILEFDFNAAIKAHIDWKMKLGNYLKNPDGSLDHKKVGVDNACVLGKWLHGDGLVYKDRYNQIYENVRESHALFHRTAGKIIEHLNKGEKTSAEKLLAPEGDYVKISSRTVDLIKELKKKVESDYLKREVS